MVIFILARKGRNLQLEPWAAPKEGEQRMPNLRGLWQQVTVAMCWKIIFLQNHLRSDSESNTLNAVYPSIDFVLLNPEK